MLQHLHELPGLEQRVVRAGVEPGEPAAELDQRRPVLAHVGEVDVGDLQLAARRRLQRARDVDHVVVVEVQPGDRLVRARLLGLLLDGDQLAVRADLADAVALGVLHRVAEQDAAVELAHGLLEAAREALAVEDVVAEHQRHVVVADEVRADDEGLGQPVRARLLGVGEREAELVAVAEQLAEVRQVGGGGDDQDLPDPGQHQHRDRVVDHRLVVDRQQLLRHRLGDRVQACPAASGQHDALHWLPPVRPCSGRAPPYGPALGGRLGKR